MWWRGLCAEGMSIEGRVWDSENPPGLVCVPEASLGPGYVAGQVGFGCRKMVETEAKTKKVRRSPGY